MTTATEATTADTPKLVAALQERTAYALPADRNGHVDGWWLRHADSAQWWLSSVLPHGDTPLDALPDRIRLVEEFYARHGGPARFQISPGACPAALDETLAARGYRRECPVSLQTAPTTQVAGRLPTPPSRVRIDDTPTDAWFDAWLSANGIAGDPTPEWDMVRRVTRTSAYVSVLGDAGVIAVGRVVADTGWAGVFTMATRPEARGRGAATAVLATLARWAHDHGAGQMYLQVEPGNTAAWRLYARAGFAELCRYHYRVAGPVAG